jgi:hypothetical protein
MHGVLSLSRDQRCRRGLHDEACFSSGRGKRSTVCCLSRGINVVAGGTTRRFPQKGRREALCAVSLELLTSSQDSTTRRCSWGREKRSTVCCRSRGTNVVAGCTTGRFRREGRGEAGGAVSLDDLTLSQECTRISSVREKKSTVCCLSREINVITKCMARRFPRERRREARCALSVEVLTSSRDCTTRRFPSGREKRSTVCCLSRGF